MNQPPRSASEVLKLQRPMSVAIYDDYADAQQAVDYLADRHFPVNQLAIVGTDLKSVEKVTGQVTWGRVLLGGFLQGAMWAGMFALVMYFAQPGLGLMNALLIGLVGFGLVGMVMAGLQYRAQRGQRDYTSTINIIATHYEVLAESTVADQARSLLSGGSAHKTREVTAHPAATSVVPPAQSQPSAEPADLGTLPPPFGQQPSGGWGPSQQPSQSPPPGQQTQPTPPAAQPPGSQYPASPPPPAAQSAPSQPAPPAQPAAPETPMGEAPYGQFWGEDDPPGIGDPPRRGEQG